MGSGDARLVDGRRRGTPAAFAGLHERYATASTTSPCAWSGRTGRGGHHPGRAHPRVRAPAAGPRGAVEAVAVPAHAEPLLRLPARGRPAAIAGRAGPDLPSPQDPYDQSELQRLLEAAIGDLTRRQRRARAQGRPRALAGRGRGMPGLTPGSVEVLLARARRAFRARFEERCIVAGRPSPRRPAASCVCHCCRCPRPPGRVGAPAGARTFRSHAADRRAVPATHGGGRERHRRRARPAGIIKTAVLIAAAAATWAPPSRGHAGRPSSAAAGPASPRSRRGRPWSPSPSTAPSRSPPALATAPRRPPRQPASPAAARPAFAVADRGRGPTPRGARSGSRYRRRSRRSRRRRRYPYGLRH